MTEDDPMSSYDAVGQQMARYGSWQFSDNQPYRG